MGRVLSKLCCYCYYKEDASSTSRHEPDERTPLLLPVDVAADENKEQAPHLQPDEQPFIHPSPFLTGPLPYDQEGSQSRKEDGPVSPSVHVGKVMGGNVGVGTLHQTINQGQAGGVKEQNITNIHHHYREKQLSKEKTENVSLPRPSAGGQPVAGQHQPGLAESLDSPPQCVVKDEHCDITNHSKPMEGGNQKPDDAVSKSNEFVVTKEFVSFKDVVNFFKEQSVTDSTTFDSSFTRLIKECLPDALAKLQSPSESQERNFLKKMNTLCFEAAVSKRFLENLLRHVSNCLKSLEHLKAGQDLWDFSPQSLHDVGSLSNTSRYRVRNIVSVVIAEIVRVVDVDNNLDLLVEDCRMDNGLTELWLQMFSSKEFCDFRWSNVAEKLDFVVDQKSQFSCHFPFCRVVFESMEKIWTFIEESSMAKKKNIYFSKIKNSLVHHFLELACNKTSMYLIKRFTHDLVIFMHKSRTHQKSLYIEYETVCDCIIELFKALRKQVQKSHCNPFVEIYVIFVNNHSQLKQFAEIVAAHPDILENRDEWIVEQSKTTEFVAHELAFKTLVKKLQTDGPKNIATLETYYQWKSLVTNVKHVSNSLISIPPYGTKQACVQIGFIESFLNQLIPPFAAEKVAQNYLATLAPYARRLWKSANESKDLSHLQFIKTFAKTLQGCIKDIELRLLCSWNDIKCKSCKSEKLSNTVFFPCQHYVCQKCVILAAVITCPICKKNIPSIDVLRPAVLSLDQKKELGTFKSACTSFFLDYLSKFCFPEAVVREHHDGPPEQNITFALDKLVICDSSVKDINPMFIKFHLDSSTRSYILQLLLCCDALFVKNHLNKHFKTTEEVTLENGVLMDIYIQSMQNLLQNRSYDYEVGEDSVLHFHYAEELIKECTERKALNFSQIQHLDRSAKLQHVARVAVSSIVSLENEKAVHFRDYQLLMQFLKDVGKLCADPKYIVMQQYIVKCLCRRHGVDLFHTLLESKIYRPLVPQNLIPVKDATMDKINLQTDDMLVLFGEGYIKTKTLLLDVANETDCRLVFTKIINEFQPSVDGILQILLAFSVWSTQCDDNAGFRKGAFKYIVNHQLQTLRMSVKNHQVFNDISQGTLNNLPFVNITVQRKHKIVELLTNLQVTLLCSDAGPLANFGLFLTHPVQLSNAFLPTMPSVNLFIGKHVLQSVETTHNRPPALLLCPNGHPYFVGQSGRPLQTGVCPDCHQRIGGITHGVLHEGNTVGKISEESQAGYKLAAADKRTPSAPERKLTRQSVCAIRLCLHAVMFLGAQHGDDVAKILKCGGNREEVFSFLLQHITKDLEELSDCLCCSIDDAFIILHKVFHRMRTTKVQQKNFNWQSMAAIELWEEEFQRTYLSPVFKNSDVIIDDGHKVLIEAGKLKEKRLERLIYEVMLEKNVPDGVVEWNCPELWKYRIHVDMEHLRQKLEAVAPSSAVEGAMLKVILNTEHLDLVQHLPDVFNLQAALIARYLYKMDMADSDNMRLLDYLEGENDILLEEVELYIRIWNKVRLLLPSCDRYNTPREFFSENMSLESPISMCLPCKNGIGRCSLVLAEHLINKQNDLLHQCRELAQPPPTFFAASVPECSKQNVICINENKDILPLPLQNSDYETATGETGRTPTVSYNLGLLEKKVMEKFIFRKAHIKKETIPLMLYPQDTGLARRYKTFQKISAHQIPLSIQMSQDVDISMEDAQTESICEVVRTLVRIIQLLAKFGADPKQTISDYAEKYVLLAAEETKVIPRTAQICHCVALYERISWHRLKRLAANGLQPFENVAETMEDIEDDHLVALLKKELSTMNVQTLQLELNALLMMGPTMNPDWSLGEEVLFNYLELKYDEMDNSWCGKIPKEILFKHSAHVFRLSLEPVAISVT